MRPETPAGPARDAALAILVAIGASLRLGRLDSSPLYGDEVHSLTLARGLGQGWLGEGVLIASGGYGPFADWASWLISIGRFDETSFRFPSAVAASLLLVAVALWLRRSAAPAVAVLGTGLVAFSPYLIYLAREARGYPIAILAFALASLAAARWARPLGDASRDRPAWAGGAVALAAIACVFDLAAAPSLALVVAAAVAAVAIRGEARHRLRSFAVALGVAALAAVASSDTIAGVFDEATRASAEARPHWQTLARAWTLGLGASADRSAIVGAAGLGLFALGMARARAMPVAFRSGATLGLGLLAAQILLLAIVRPRTVEVDWVALRYAVHLLPFVLIGIGCGVAPPGAWSARRPVAAVLVSTLAVAALAGVQARAGRYDALRESCSPAKPNTWATLGSESDAAVGEVMPAFYRDVLPALPEGRVIEAPHVVSFPLYEWYRRQHGRACSTAALGDGLFQASVAESSGGPHPIELARTTSALELHETRGTARFDDARVLIVHRHPWIELSRISAALRRIDPARPVISPRAARAIFTGRADGAGSALALPEGHSLDGGYLFHRDDEVDVYILPGNVRGRPGSK